MRLLLITALLLTGCGGGQATDAGQDSSHAPVAPVCVRENAVNCPPPDACGFWAATCDDPELCVGGDPARAVWNGFEHICIEVCVLGDELPGGARLSCSSLSALCPDGTDARCVWVPDPTPGPDCESPVDWCGR